MSEKLISLARDFSRHPGPRFKEQGPFSGEAFRKVLLDALSKSDIVIVDLDGTSGIGSSFIDEAFGGLVKREGFAPADLRRRIRVKSDLDESYLVEFNESIQDKAYSRAS